MRFRTQTDTTVHAQATKLDAVASSQYALDTVFDQDQTTYRFRSALARFQFTITGAWFTVTAISTGMVAATGSAAFNVNIDGTDYLCTVTADNTPQTFSFSFAYGTHAVTITEGPQASTGTSNPYAKGTFVQSISAARSATFTPVAPSAPSRQLVVVCDSNGNGFWATNPSVSGWGALVRASYPGSVTIAGWGSEALLHWHGNIAALVAIVRAACTGIVRNDVLWALGTNDIRANLLGNFQSDLELAITSTATQGITGLHQYVMSAIPIDAIYEGIATTERGLCAAACTNTGATLISGTGFGLNAPPSADYNADNTHLSNAGHAKVATGVLAALT